MKKEDKEAMMYRQLAEMMLPKGILEYFEVEGLSRRTDRTREGEEVPVVVVDLKERNIPPERRGKLTSNGFVEGASLYDYPIRGQRMLLRFRRRRWVDEEGRSVTRDWSGLGAKGVKITAEFAAFLKWDN